ncbi:MAG: 3-isopropylmalate dehydratase small subunit [archaeon]|nr:3-isopropylmalate dehydratase small subunit [archaeon]
MALVIPEKRIAHIVGRAIPKPANDQNTDDIMPARYLKEITFKDMGKYVYADERFMAGITNPLHPFNESKYNGANILLAGANYGCGSSREHAPQGLLKYGIKAIVAESFAEIFAGNCAAIGIVPVTMDRSNIELLVSETEQNPKGEFVLDLVIKSLEFNRSAQGLGFDIPEGRRRAFLNGTWDSMAVLQQNQEQVELVRKNISYLNR